jgi:Ca2+-binding RTX toxin-like protein
MRRMRSGTRQGEAKPMSRPGTSLTAAELAGVTGGTTLQEATTRADTIAGSADADFAYASSGDDEVHGEEGEDTLCGVDGDDTVYGGAGADKILGGVGADNLYGQGGADTIDAGGEADLVWAGDGDDHVYGELGRDYVNGEGGRDFVLGEDGNDVLLGGRDDQAADTLDGGTGDDTLVWSPGGGDDQFKGGTGHDTLRLHEVTMAELLAGLRLDAGAMFHIRPDGTLRLTGPDGQGGSGRILLGGEVLTFSGIETIQLP